MAATPVIAIADVGKTNRKFLLFDESYTLRYEAATGNAEIKDEDGFPCEDIGAITGWIKRSLGEFLENKEFNVKAINFSAHGAGFVHQDEKGAVIAPLYNYLKPYPEKLRKRFYDAYGGEAPFSKATASPVLGSLNSGLQLFRIKHERPELFQNIKYSLHLPQFLSMLFTQKAFSDITSIGCHTGMWDFEKQDYHAWVHKEEIYPKLAPITSTDTVTHVDMHGHSIAVGIGLHDSSAALIPYLKQFEKSFALISTGTWNITLNPFNSTALTDEELLKDCLCYMSYGGRPVKAARLFAGHAHDEQLMRLADHFHQRPGYQESFPFDKDYTMRLKSERSALPHKEFDPKNLLLDDFFNTSFAASDSFEHAYHQLILDLVTLQFESTSLVLRSDTKKLFVDGGFCKNMIFMNMLKEFFPSLDVYAATAPHASSLGAAMAIHSHWNSKEFPKDRIGLTRI